MATLTARPVRGKYTNSFLDPFQRQGDPLADAAIAALGGRLQANLLAQVEKLAKRGDSRCRDFLDACHTVPSWADLEAMEAGRRLGFKYAPLTGIVLLAGSLVEGYALARPAKVLAATGRLTHDVRRRLFETSDFTYQLGRHGGIRHGGEGHRGIMKVRLLHAAVRRHLLRSPAWKPRRDGLPINQEDLAITLCEFGYEIRRGLKRMGVRLTPAEEDSHLLFWRYVGHVLGIDHALLPRTRAQELALYTAITRRQRRITPEGVALTHATLDAMANTSPFFLPRAALHQVSRNLIGDDLADQLEIPRSYLARPALGALFLSARTLSRTEQFVPGVNVLLYHAGHLYVSRLLRILLPSNPASDASHQ